MDPDPTENARERRHEVVREFLRDVFRGKPDAAYILVWQRRRKKSHWFTDSEVAVATVMSMADEDAYVGFGLSTEDFGPKNRCKAEHVAGVVGFVIDFDFQGPAHQKSNLPPTIDDALSLLPANLPPTDIVHSGHGIQAWWLFKTPWMFEAEQERNVAAALAQRFNLFFKSEAKKHDWDVDSTFDLARVYRIPGTMNCKPGLPPCLATIQSRGGHRYNPADIVEFLNAVGAPAPAKRMKGRPEGPGEEFADGNFILNPGAEPPRQKFRVLMEGEPRFADAWEHRRSDFQDQSPSVYDMSLAYYAAACGWSDQEIVDLLIAHRRKHAADLKLRHDYYALTISKARKSAAEYWKNVEPGELLEATVADACSPELHNNMTSETGRTPEVLEDNPDRHETERTGAVDSLQPEPVSIADTAPASRTKRPKIRVNNRSLDETAREAITALERKGGLYRRAGALVVVREDEIGHALIERLDQASMRSVLARAADYVTHGSTRKVPTLIDPPMPLVNDVLHCGEGNFPPLTTLTAVPIVHTDGSVWTEPGYDVATHIYYSPEPGFRLGTVPVSPTRQDARIAARFIIDEILCDFPFADPADQANAMAAILTAPVPASFGMRVPLFLFDAPQGGSGKTLLASTTAAIATGRAVALSAFPENDSEMRKVITTKLDGGEPVVIFDNVRARLASAPLEAVLTSDVWADRILGRNEQVRAPNRTIWMVTANNARLGSETGRRTCPIMLDPKTGRPEKRTGFKKPDQKLIVWALRNRGEIIARLVTMIRAWYVAGQPEANVVPLGTFSPWAQFCAGVLQFAGIEGFLQNLETLHTKANDESAGWERFFTLWARWYGDQEVYCATLVNAITKEQAFFEYLPDDLDVGETAINGTFSFTKRVGKALKKKVGVRFGDRGLYLECRIDGHSKLLVYRLRGDLTGLSPSDPGVRAALKAENELANARAPCETKL